MTDIAIVTLSPATAALAESLRDALPGARVHGLAGRCDDADVVFDDAMAHLRALFAAGQAIVGLCAAGILIRAVAPALADKTAEPPVVAVSPDGGHAVPLLGGHRGANALARDIAAIAGGAAAVTTAGDGAFGMALDEPPPGWRVANPALAKPVTAELLAGRPVRLVVEAGDAGWLQGSGAPFCACATPLSVRITERAVEADDALVLHPPVLALGVGCERGAEPAELIGLVRETLAEHGLAQGAVAGVYSIDLKADEGAVHALAAELGVPARFFGAAELEAEAPRLANPSDVVFAETGCHGVSEGAALAAAGRDAGLVVAKTKSKRCTCAVALAPAGVGAAGKPRGSLAVVGIGPGSAEWRTPEADRAVALAEDVVGYGLYLDLLGPAIAGKRRHESALGAEEDRARIALDLAAQGRRVALVCSGDAGIYALATLVFELMDREDRADWNRLAVSVVPGVSALQAAAARAGAPINHDFCTISLSDLLTPWPAIERRVRAAAAGDFVVAFYNPVSKRRRDQLARARDMLLEARPPETPVVLARNLGRPGETVETVTLAELDPERVDMLTVVLVGSSETRRMRDGRIYTPRGYAAKMG